MDVEEKIKEDMRKLGCQCAKKRILAYRLYIHLIEEKLMYDTEYCYNKDIDTMYVVARPRKNDKLNIYVPLLTSEHISMDYISILQDNLCTVETGLTVNLALVEADFTIVIYTFTKGLVERRTSETTSQMKSKAEKRTLINNDLRKKRNRILNEALDGGVVDDDDEIEISD